MINISQQFHCTVTVNASKQGINEQQFAETLNLTQNHCNFINTKLQSFRITNHQKLNGFEIYLDLMSHADVD